MKGNPFDESSPSRVVLDKNGIELVSGEGTFHDWLLVSFLSDAKETVAKTVANVLNVLEKNS